MSEEALLADTGIGVKLYPKVWTCAGEIVGREVSTEPAQERGGGEVTVSYLGDAR